MKTSFATVIFLFFVITKLESAHIDADHQLHKHSHNIIGKDDRASQTAPADSTESNPDNSEAFLKIKSPLKTKNIPLRIPKPNSSIKHALPPSWHDIMPHEPQRPIDDEKIHNDFVHHEGPKLQRRLHLEELRQRRKELREKWLARHNKLNPVMDARIAQPKIGILTPSSTSTETTGNEHHIVGKQIEMTTKTQENIGATTERIDLVQMRHSIPIVTQESNSRASNIEDHLPILKSYMKSPRINFHLLDHLEHKPHYKEPDDVETTTKSSLLDSLRNDHRFAPVKKLTYTTLAPSSTTVEKGVEAVLYIPNNLPHFVTNEAEMTTKSTISTTVLVAATAPKEENEAGPPEVTTMLTTTDEPEMYKDWKKHLREAIKRRLHRLRQQTQE